MRKKRLWQLSVVLLVTVAGILAFKATDKYFEMAKSLDMMASVYRDLNSYYVDSLDPAALMERGITAMTQGLDPYTVFYNERHTNELLFQTTGQYAGIGASFRLIGDSIVLSALFPDAPFAKAGFKPGDVLVALDQQAVTGMNPEDVHAMLQGAPGSLLSVQVRRPWTGEVMQKDVKREIIAVSAIPYKTVLRDHIGYICFQQFTKGCAADLKAAIGQLKKEDPGLQGLIIDLRNNPGGLLGEAVKISNFFLPQGDTIVSVKGRIPSWNAAYTASDKPLDTLLPLAVLINGSSASAAEIFAGAMQDQDRAVIIGQQSFGKGLVQITRDLPYDTKLKLTVARYYTPSGRCIQAIDYRHDGNMGGPVYIPDSLQQQFTTADGRVVFDKGGITPDTTVDDSYLSHWASALINDNVFFRFAARYYHQHPQAPPLGAFTVSDSLFTAFQDYVKAYPLTYGSRSEMALDRFQASAMSEGYFDSVRTLYDSLAGAISRFTQPGLAAHREEASQLLAAEIMNCYYVQSGKIAVGIGADEVVQRAVAVLTQDRKYAALLR